MFAKPFPLCIRWPLLQLVVHLELAVLTHIYSKVDSKQTLPGIVAGEYDDVAVLL